MLATWLCSTFGTPSSSRGGSEINRETASWSFIDFYNDLECGQGAECFMRASVKLRRHRLISGNYGRNKNVLFCCLLNRGNMKTCFYLHRNFEATFFSRLFAFNQREFKLEEKQWEYEVKKAWSPQISVFKSKKVRKNLFSRFKIFRFISSLNSSWFNVCRKLIEIVIDSDMHQLMIFVGRHELCTSSNLSHEFRRKSNKYWLIY